MTPVEIKCSECGFALQIDEQLLGTTMKCPKCKETFFAETGDSYDLVDMESPPSMIVRHTSDDDSDADDTPRRGAARSPSDSSSSSHSRPAPKSKPAPPSKPKKESKAEREQRERMEKWAEKLGE